RSSLTSAAVISAIANPLSQELFAGTWTGLDAARGRVPASRPPCRTLRRCRRFLLLRARRRRGFLALGRQLLRREFLRLADIGAGGDHLLLQPVEDRGGSQVAIERDGADR